MRCWIIVMVVGLSLNPRQLLCMCAKLTTTVCLVFIRQKTIQKLFVFHLVVLEIYPTYETVQETSVVWCFMKDLANCNCLVTKQNLCWTVEQGPGTGGECVVTRQRVRWRWAEPRGCNWVNSTFSTWSTVEDWSVAERWACPWASRRLARSLLCCSFSSMICFSRSITLWRSEVTWREGVGENQDFLTTLSYSYSNTCIWVNPSRPWHV